jgi:hypothetical protein
LGVLGKALKWFLCYMSGEKQRVNWDGVLSNLIEVKYGVRQGSILSPILFIVLVGDMAISLSIGNV